MKTKTKAHSNRKVSKLKHKKASSKLSLYISSELFTYKEKRPVKPGCFPLRSNLLCRALIRNLDVLKLLGVGNLKKIVISYIYNFEKVSSEKGLLYACKYFKNIYSYCQRFAVSHTPEPIPFTKVNKKGIPLIVSPITKLLMGTLLERKCALQILQIYKLVETNNKEVDYSSITNPSKVDNLFVKNEVGGMFDYISSQRVNEYRLIQSIRKNFINTLETLFPSSKLEIRMKSLSKLSDIHISGKRGPNGPSLTHSALDFVALQNDSNGLLDSIKQISKITDNTKLLDIIETFESEDGVTIESGDVNKLVTSKLSLKQEVGGKNRIFAIGDWFSQSALKGLHTYLFRILKTYPEDGTNDHNTLALQSREWTKQVDIKINAMPHSVDLTKATDRLPSIIQREIILHMFGKEFADHWYNLMTNRDFIDIERRNFYKYKVGQPLGILSSWAMLAITHHVLLQTILRTLRINRIDPITGVNNYLIIGDDVAMRGKKIYNLYMYIMVSLLEVPVSELKGFTPETLNINLNPLQPDDEYYRPSKELIAVEIAKRIFVNGYEVTPVSPVAIQTGLELPSDFPSLLDEFNRRGYQQLSEADTAISLCKLSFNPASALSLATIPISCAPQFEGVTRQVGADAIYSKSPWISPSWTSEDNSKLVKALVKSMRSRLNTGIADVYRTIIPYMDYDCKYSTIQLKRGMELQSTGLALLLNYVYRKCQDLVTDWAGDFSKEQTKLFWVGENPDPIEFKRYLGRMHVIFDITTALEGTSQVLDEKRFSSKFLMEIVKDFIKDNKDLRSET